MKEIKQLVDRYGITQEELAVRLKCSVRAVYYWYTGQRKVQSRLMLDRIKRLIKTQGKKASENN